MAENEHQSRQHQQDSHQQMHAIGVGKELTYEYILPNNGIKYYQKATDDKYYV
jgi:hypothetical protein